MTAPTATRCPAHDTAHGVPFSREQQFNLDWTDYCRWATNPAKSSEDFRAEWDKRHPDCV